MQWAAAASLLALAHGAKWVRPAPGAAADCSLRFSSFYFYNTTAQNGTLNFGFANDPAQIRAAATARPPIRTLYNIFWNVVVPQADGNGYSLAPNFQALFFEAWNSEILALVQEGFVIGFFLGDEIGWQGLTVAEISALADYARALWPPAIVYYNEAVPALTTNKDAWGRPLGYGNIPTNVDWFSVDFYALDSTAWTYPRDTLYPTVIYPRLSPSQCVLTVPGSYGSNAAANPPSWYVSFMTEVANQYFQWAQTDPRIIGLNPWYFLHQPNMPSSFNPYDLSTGDLPALAAVWAGIGRQILAAAGDL